MSFGGPSSRTEALSCQTAAVDHAGRVDGATDDEQQSACTLVIRLERLPIRGSARPQRFHRPAPAKRHFRRSDPHALYWLLQEIASRNQWIGCHTGVRRNAADEQAEHIPVRRPPAQHRRQLCRLARLQPCALNDVASGCKDRRAPRTQEGIMTVGVTDVLISGHRSFRARSAESVAAWGREETSERFDCSQIWAGQQETGCKYRQEEAVACCDRKKRSADVSLLVTGIPKAGPGAEPGSSPSASSVSSVRRV